MLVANLILSAQNLETRDDSMQNSAENMIANDDKKLTIGGYAQIDYNQPIEKGYKMNGTLDVHRLVLLFGYKFSPRVSFITEIEVEHVSEVFVEQAFLNYKVNDWLNLRGGLLLIPMGIINQYHEPPTFNGVERPALDYWICPTTWREIGFGATGQIPNANIRYQLYVVNGLKSFDDGGKLDGANGFRKGRQKGMESIIGSPDVTARIDYFGVRSLTIGASVYSGKTQSTLFKNVSKEDVPSIDAADSSIVNITMFGLDARYNWKGIALRSQMYYSKQGNTTAYNSFTGKDLGEVLGGYYLEAAYNVFSSFTSISSELTPFIRYENYNTQMEMSGGLAANDAYKISEIVVGLGWKPVRGAVVKADFQFVKPADSNVYQTQLNVGIGVWF
jgi:hypothetical protein